MICAFLSGLWRQRALILLLVRREIASRYRGSFIGVLWSLVTPLLMLATYAFVFSVVFNARWGMGNGNRAEFALLLFVGLLAHGFLAECLTRAPSMMLMHANLVKKVAFPLEILPVVLTGSALFNAAINLLVLIFGWFVSAMPVHATLLLLPLAFLPLLFLGMGVAWSFAALGVYVRDTTHFTGLSATLLLFLAPVFYPQSALPPIWRPWLNLNPLTFIIESARKTLVGEGLDWPLWWLALLLSLLAAAGGAWCFQKGRRGFADVL